MTDHDLVVRSRAGDAEAFGELADRHRVAVYRAALAALQRPAEADDVTQEAFIPAFRRVCLLRRWRELRGAGLQPGTTENLLSTL